jgi:hypothetical protein
MIYCPNGSESESEWGSALRPLIAGCRKWYHTKCLSERDLHESATPTALGKLKASGLQLLQDFTFTLDHLDEADDTDVPDVADLDARLRAAAQSSIERGGKDTGIVGNGRSVILARSLLKRWGESSEDDKTLAGDLAQWYAHFGWDVEDPDAAPAGADAQDKFKGDVKVEGLGPVQGKTNGFSGASSKNGARERVWTCPSCSEPI